MNASSLPPPAPPRSVLGRFLRISLRTFLLAFTAIAIGFPIWYRWPYTEETPYYHMIRQPDGTTVPDTTRPPQRRVVTTWRRLWGGKRTMWGPQWHYDHKGKLEKIIEYYEDRPTDEQGQRWAHAHVSEPVVAAPVTTLESAPRAVDVPRIVGRFRNGVAEGQWIINHASGCQIMQTLRDDQLDGPFEVRWPGAEPFRMEFSRGHLTQMQGQRVDSALFNDLADSHVPVPLAVKLLKPVTCEYIQTPFKDAMQILQDSSQTQILIDPRSCDVEMPITQNVGGLDLASTLVLLIYQYQLDCDYRYDCLWITRSSAAKNPQTFQFLKQMDRAAVDAERIRNALAATARAEFIDTPLRDAAQILSDAHAIPVFVQQASVDPELPITLNIHDVTLQSAICALCELHELDCDYRYGALWFTGREEGEERGMGSDPTGISSLVSPKDSPLEAAWNKDVFNEQESEEPLTSFVTRLSREKGLDVNIYRVGGVERMRVRTHWKGLPLRDVLGIFLYENGLQCRLDGDQLVLFPAAE